MAPIDRRDFLSTLLAAPAFFTRHQPSGARFIRTLPLGNPVGGRTAPLERLLGSGLNARLFTDLSTLTPDRPDSVLTPTARFFVRTAAPRPLPDASTWTIEIGGLVDEPARVALSSLAPHVSPAGRYLVECSGNTDPANYGLLSTADWDGVPLLPLLDRVRPSAGNTRLLVIGFDDATDPARTSIPGASWIFSRDDLRRAVLATRMNGAPLTQDHGSPVRLVVPGWYGCACIKWVNGIAFVADDVPATSQMREFAARTHQPFDSRADAGSLRARDFIPAVIDTAAMPVRVEQWADNSGVFYRVIGIIWGGASNPRPTNALSIRFRSNLPWTRVEDCPMPSSTDAWSLWTHTWRPTEPGRYTIVLRVDDQKIRTRRLDVFFYARDIEITEI
jgi:DMSO/TMAO reductase YedYZ molybdopterin-dependent catalytic subunit